MPESYTYPDKLGYGETIMFHIRCMSSELGQDGMDKEFEDMVDFLGLLVWPYLGEDERKEWDEVAKDGLEHDISTEPILWGKAKRRRIQGKTRIAMGILDKKGLLLKKIASHDADMEYYNDLGEKK